MGDFEHKDEERISRQKAAEIFVDFAYVLTTGGPLRLEGDERVTVADEVVLKREGKSTDDRVELELELSWSTATAPSLDPPEAPHAE
jgi:amphi-Trp domain-containing protein